MLLAQLAVENTTYRFDKPFTYIVPEALRAAVCPGVRVTVPFGSGNRTRVAMVLALQEAEQILSEAENPEVTIPQEA